MEDSNKKAELIKAVMGMECYNYDLDETVSVDNLTKIPIGKIASMGVAFEPLSAAFQNVFLGQAGTVSGLYRVTIPAGGKLAAFNDGSGFLGSVLTQGGQVGGGQARLNPLMFDPTMMLIAIALASIHKSLDTIQEMQQDILQFLEQKEKAMLRGNLNVLMDILTNYNFNWDNEKYKTNKHIQVQEINRDAEQSIIFYRKQIERKVGKKSLLHSDKEVKSKINTVQAEFKEYQLALYLYAFSSFLEVMLLENFDSAYLDGIVNKIEEYSYQYRELYTDCFNQIEQYSKSSIQTNILSGLAGINKAVGKAVAKVPVVSKSQIDETLIEVGDRLGKLSTKNSEQVMVQFTDNQSNGVRPFINNINVVNQLYNQPLELIFDKDNVYFAIE